jgi:hypothetical protein
MTQIIHTMESKTNKVLSTSSSNDVILMLRVNEYILLHISTFLDFESLLQFRLVSHEWNAACLPILMKRGTYNLSHPSPHENERPNFLKGAIHYSSWKISHSVYKSSEILHDNGMWQNVKSVTIQQQIPLTREFYSWAWDTIGTRCPNLQDLTFIFQPVFDSNLDSVAESEYERALIELHNNVSFPKISNFRNLTSIKFKGIYDKTTAYFAESLLQACNNLRHLYFSRIGEPGKWDENVSRIFGYLLENPTLLKKLQTFAFSIGSYTANERYKDCVRMNIEQKRCQFINLLRREILLVFQFSDNLRTLFWDAHFVRNGFLLPGVLTESIASSLVQLCLNGTVHDLGPNYSSWPFKISSPNFPNLRALKLGLDACQTLCVPELVDSAPNLYVLEMKVLKALCTSDHNVSDIWRVKEEESYSNPKHNQLRIFCTDIPILGSSIIEKISGKFPNLVEFRLGLVYDVGLDPFLSIVKSNHSQLQRLTWTHKETINDKFTLDEIFRHLIRVSEQLPTLSLLFISVSYLYSYSFIDERNLNDRKLLISIHDQDYERLANSLLSLPSNSGNNSCLIINMLIKYTACHCKPEDEEQSARDGCKGCYLQKFIRTHKLPVRIISEREMEEMKWKNKRDFCFDSTRIYK